jgi:hypothetical protein
MLALKLRQDQVRVAVAPNAFDAKLGFRAAVRQSLSARRPRLQSSLRDPCGASIKKRNKCGM